jgi:hypothetical protein
MFSIGVFLQGRPWVVQIRNFDGRTGAILNHFDTTAKEITNAGQGFLFGDPRAVIPSEQTKLMKLATRKPRTPKDFRKLLASINRRIAAGPSGKTVSPGCVTLPPAGEPVESEFHGKTGASKPLIVPMLLFGVDLTEMQRALVQKTASLSSSSNTGDALNQAAEEAGKQSVLPRNRLRR